jgi:hypothetical protein
MMCKRLRSGAGMYQSDAMRTFATGIDYAFKQQRREMVISELPPGKCKKINDHDKTKAQQKMVSDQLIEHIGEWLQKAMELLSRPGHCIPSLSELNKSGRRKEHKKIEEEDFNS